MFIFQAAQFLWWSNYIKIPVTSCKCKLEQEVKLHLNISVYTHRSNYCLESSLCVNDETQIFSSLCGVKSVYRNFFRKENK